MNAVDDVLEGQVECAYSAISSEQLLFLGLLDRDCHQIRREQAFVHSRAEDVSPRPPAADVACSFQVVKVERPVRIRCSVRYSLVGDSYRSRTSASLSGDGSEADQ